jgi:class 3 adenylate cyclase
VFRLNTHCFFNSDMPSSTITTVLRRCDFVMERVSTDEKTRTLVSRMVPDPRRYEPVDSDGAAHYRDKYLDEVLSVQDMAEAFQAPVPLFHLSSSLKSAPAYAAERRGALRGELAGGPYVLPAQSARSHSEFGVTADRRNIAFLSVDVAGSTPLRRTHGERFDTAFAVMLRELGTLVGQFNGTLLKTKGDGFIAYIDHPSFTSQCDAAIDLGLSFLVVMRDAVNPELLKVSLPALNIRVGADFGEAAVISLAVPTTGFTSRDIASDALNRAVKIEETCQLNEFRIGRRLYELIHVQWLERAQETPFSGDAVGLRGYRTYRIT